MNNTFYYKKTLICVIIAGFSLVIASTGHALSITPSFTNAIQYIKTILVTDNGNSTGILGVKLDGATSTIWSDNYCDNDGTNCYTPNQVTQGVSAYARGNHANMGYLTGSSISGSITTENDPVRTTEKSSYYNKTDINGLPLSTFTNDAGYITGVNLSGYITTETDPIFLAHPVYGITSGNIANRNTAYSWGNHAIMSYLTTETDPVRTVEKTSYYNKPQVDSMFSSVVGGLIYRGLWDYSAGALPSNIELGDFYKINGAGNFGGLDLAIGDMIIANTDNPGSTTVSDWDKINNTSTEDDPHFSISPAYNITTSQILNRNTAYTRGNHSSMGYLTSTALSGYLTTEADPVFMSHVANTITSGNITSRNTAHSWGDHASAGYITGTVNSLARAPLTCTNGQMVIFSGSSWQCFTLPAATSSVIGDIKQGIQTSDHSGWVKLNGRLKSTLTASQQTAATSLGIGANLPNADNTYLVQNGSSLGTITGSNTRTIARNQLPNTTLTGTTSSTGGHTHNVNMRNNDGGNTASPNPIGSFHYSNDPGSARDTTDRADAPLSQYKSSPLLQSTGAHTHTITTTSINGGVTQQALNIQPQSMSVNTFIYLGQ